MRYGLNNYWNLQKTAANIIACTVLLFSPGCSDGPREQYTTLCVDVAKTARQRQACTCLAYEYGKALTPEEYRTVNIMLARSIEGLREKNGKKDPVTVDKTDIDKAVYMAAMKKIALLQRSGICGYNPSQ